MDTMLVEDIERPRSGAPLTGGVVFSHVALVHAQRRLRPVAMVRLMLVA
jgi:hypothetical protein